MQSSFGKPRSAQTTVPCRECSAPLIIERSCHEVRMVCPHCHREFPLREYIAQADTAMESFLENVYCDRM